MRDFPQLQHAVPAAQCVHPPGPQQGPLGRYAGLPAPDHRGAGGAAHRQRLRLHPRQLDGVRHRPGPGGAGDPHCGAGEAHPAQTGEIRRDCRKRALPFFDSLNYVLTYLKMGENVNGYFKFINRNN